MRAIFITASVCSVASLIGLLGFSVMDIVSSPGDEVWRSGMMLAATAFLLAWLALAVWARRQTRRSAVPVALPPWLSLTVVVTGTLYVLVVLLFSVG
jgi:hypothetical protein